LDWHEGNLEASLEADLFLFLEQNPDLKFEFDSFENFKLPTEEHIIFEDKAQFKKSPIVSVGAINAANYNEYFVAAIENDLNTLELNHLNRFLERNPALVSAFTLLKQTVITPDPGVRFEGKSNLKKSISALYF